MVAKNRVGPALAVTAPWSAKEWEVQDLADHLRRIGLPDLEVGNSSRSPDSAWLVWSGLRPSHRDGIPVRLPGGVLATEMPADWDWSAFRRTLGDEEQRTNWGWKRFRFQGKGAAVAKIKGLLGK